MESFTKLGNILTRNIADNFPNNQVTSCDHPQPRKRLESLQTTGRRAMEINQNDPISLAPAIYSKPQRPSAKKDRLYGPNLIIKTISSFIRTHPRHSFKPRIASLIKRKKKERDKHKRKNEETQRPSPLPPLHPHHEPRTRTRHPLCLFQRLHLDRRHICYILAGYILSPTPLPFTPSNTCSLMFGDIFF